MSNNCQCLTSLRLSQTYDGIAKAIQANSHITEGSSAWSGSAAGHPDIMLGGALALDRPFSQFFTPVLIP